MNNPVDDLPIVAYKTYYSNVAKDNMLVTADQLIYLIANKDLNYITLCDIAVNGKGTYIQITELKCSWQVDNPLYACVVSMNDVKDLSVDNLVEIYIKRQFWITIKLHEYKNKLNKYESRRQYTSY